MTSLDSTAHSTAHNTEQRAHKDQKTQKKQPPRTDARVVQHQAAFRLAAVDDRHDLDALGGVDGRVVAQVGWVFCVLRGGEGGKGVVRVRL